VAHFLFIDESGYDSGPSPYGVLGGVAIEDRGVWNLINAMQDAEVRYFGTRYSVGQTELKAKKLISAQVFRQAALAGEIAFQERTELAKRFAFITDLRPQGEREVEAEEDTGEQLKKAMQP
jgi:hypothetical protein